MKTLVNCHVIDYKNIGDLLSSPLRYFEFPGFNCRPLDIRTAAADDLVLDHVVVGGGGLLFERFLPQIRDIQAKKEKTKLILWGTGQQTYSSKQMASYRQFDYHPYVVNTDLVGIRDFDVSLPWVPCVSCMHPAFDKPRLPEHEYVVFSHKKFQVSLPALPTLTNETTDFEQVLDFLGSGETILTSSFHGAYWGTLLGRKVLAFPFSSKFFTLKHQTALYPIQSWSPVRWRFSLLGKTLYELKYKNKYSCQMEDWQSHLAKAITYPESLAECRDRNRWFYDQVMNLIS